MYAFVPVWFSNAGNSVVSTGQANAIYRTAKEARKVQAGKLRGAGVIRYWFNDTRPGRPAQGYAGVAG